MEEISSTHVCGSQKLSSWTLFIQKEVNHAWYCKPCHLPGASEVVSLKRDSTITALLDQCNLSLTPIAIGRLQRSFSLANGNQHRKPQVDTMQRSMEELEGGDLGVSGGSTGGK